MAKYKTDGFTLIELIIVVTIIGVLAAIGIPMFKKYSESAKVIATKANHQIIKHFITYTFANCQTGSENIILEKNVFL